jgi:tetratricopeptide (TPR) repeat protein
MNTLNGVTQPSATRIANYLRSSWISLGFACLNEKEPEQARKVFETVVARYPDVGYGYHGLGRSLYDLKRYDEAIPWFEKALAMNPRLGSHYRLALIFKEKGDRARAIEYVRAFQKDVPNPQAQTQSDLKKLMKELGME